MSHLKSVPSVYDPMSVPYNYKFGGKELQETGFYDFGARMLMPDLGRWFVVDPLAELRPDLTPFRYAFNNPISYTDPTGMYEGGDEERGESIDDEDYRDSYTIRFGHCFCDDFIEFDQTTSVYVGKEDMGSDFAEDLRMENRESMDDYDATDHLPDYATIGTLAQDLARDQQDKLTRINFLQRTIIHNSSEATQYYLNGDGSPVSLSSETQVALHNSPEYIRVVRRLISGTANLVSGTFNVDLTFTIFHVGNTNVDYKTTCQGAECTTVFTEFVRDGFWDPDFIDESAGWLRSTNTPDGKGPNLERFGGTPYDYIPSVWEMKYKNPGYPIKK